MSILDLKHRYLRTNTGTELYRLQLNKNVFQYIFKPAVSVKQNIFAVLQKNNTNSNKTK